MMTFKLARALPGKIRKIILDRFRSRPVKIALE